MLVPVPHKLIKFNYRLIAVVILLFVLNSCNQLQKSSELPQRNTPFVYSELTTESDEFSIFRQIVSFKTDTTLNAFIEYWDINNRTEILRSDSSLNKTQHSIKLLHLKPETKYEFRIILDNSQQYSETEIQNFTSRYIPVWLDNYYQEKENTVDIEGKILIYKRKSPGVLVMLNSKGKVEWYNVFNQENSSRLCLGV